MLVEVHWCPCYVFVPNVVYDLKIRAWQFVFEAACLFINLRGTLFRHICIVVKGNLALSRQSARLSTWCFVVPIEWIFVKFCIGVGLQKSVEKIQVCLKSDKNNRHFAFRSTFIDDYLFLLICLLISWTGKEVSWRNREKMLHLTTFYFHTITTFPSSESYTIQRIILSLTWSTALCF